MSSGYKVNGTDLDEIFYLIDDWTNGSPIQVTADTGFKYKDNNGNYKDLKDRYIKLPSNYENIGTCTSTNFLDVNDEDLINIFAQKDTTLKSSFTAEGQAGGSFGGTMSGIDIRSGYGAKISFDYVHNIDVSFNIYIGGGGAGGAGGTNRYGGDGGDCAVIENATDNTILCIAGGGGGGGATRSTYASVAGHINQGYGGFAGIVSGSSITDFTSFGTQTISLNSKNYLLKYLGNNSNNIDDNQTGNPHGRNGRKGTSSGGIGGIGGTNTHGNAVGSGLGASYGGSNDIHYGSGGAGGSGSYNGGGGGGAGYKGGSGGEHSGDTNNVGNGGGGGGAGSSIVLSNITYTMSRSINMNSGKVFMNGETKTSTQSGLYKTYT